MSDDLDQVLEAGTLLVIETGEYSDYASERPVRMLKSVTKRQLADEFIASASSLSLARHRYGKPNGSDFLPWLVREGYVEAVDNVNVWHVGAYGFDPNGRDPYGL